MRSIAIVTTLGRLLSFPTTVLYGEEPAFGLSSYRIVLLLVRNQGAHRPGCFPLKCTGVEEQVESAKEIGSPESIGQPGAR